MTAYLAGSQASLTTTTQFQLALSSHPMPHTIHTIHPTLSLNLLHNITILL